MAGILRPVLSVEPILHRASLMQPSNGPAIGSIEWRRAPRLEVTGQIQGQILGIDAPIIVCEISVDGFRIVTSVEIAVDAIHELRFTLQDGSTLFARRSRDGLSRAVASRGTVVFSAAVQALRFHVAVFLGAFLLFLVQPLMAKQILPWFGGGSVVWASCLLFFQVALVGGYAYAHVSRRLGVRRQIWLHLILLIVALVTLPITPAAAWKPIDGTAPVARVLGVLTLTVGFPYVLLAATAPMLQDWFARRFPDRSPYRLYVLSNVGIAAGARRLSALPRALPRSAAAGRRLVGRLCRVRPRLRLVRTINARDQRGQRRDAAARRPRAGRRDRSAALDRPAGLRIGSARRHDEQPHPGRRRSAAHLDRSARVVSRDVHSRVRGLVLAVGVGLGACHPAGCGRHLRQLRLGNADPPAGNRARGGVHRRGDGVSRRARAASPVAGLADGLLSRHFDRRQRRRGVRDAGGAGPVHLVSGTAASVHGDRGRAAGARLPRFSARALTGHGRHRSGRLRRRALLRGGHRPPPAAA